MPGADFARHAGLRGGTQVTMPRSYQSRINEFMVNDSTGATMRPADNATILVAEDHLDSRDALRALLEAFGYKVIEAANGRQAVELALSERPDLVLMDIMMPELDGFEATRQLRAREETRALPILAVTAMEGAHQLAIQAGANDCMRKPVDLRGLIQRVSSLLGGTPDA